MGTQPSINENFPDGSLPEGGQTESDPREPRQVNPFLKWILLPIAVIAFGLYESACYLWRRVYGSEGGNFFLLLLGVVVSLGAGIGSGYYVGWIAEAAVAKWVFTGTATAVLTFIYAWPAFYDFVARSLVDLSLELWDTVPNTGFDQHSVRSHHRDGTKRRSGWLSTLLGVLSIVAVFAGTCALGLHVGGAVYAKISVPLINFAVAAFCTILFVSFVGSLAVSLVRHLDMVFAAIATGLGFGYLLGQYNVGLVSSYGIPEGASWVVTAAEFMQWVSFVVPLVHVAISWAGEKLSWVLERYRDFFVMVYEEKSGGYREFFLHSVNIALAVVVGCYAYGAALSLTLPTALVVGATAFASAASYLCIGKVLVSTGNIFVSFITSLALGGMAFSLYRGSDLPLGSIGAIVALAAVGLANFLLVYPVSYLLVRLVARPLFSSWLRDPLVNLHEFCYKGITQAAGKAYGENTAFAGFFSQVANIVVAVAVGWICFTVGGAAFGSTFLAAIATAIVVGASYLLVGKVFRRSETVGVGLAASILLAAESFFAYLENGLWFERAGAAGAAALTFVAVFTLLFPVAYLLVRRALSRLIPETAQKSLVELHDRLFLEVRHAFTYTYRDTTEYRDLFLHIVNLKVAVGSAFLCLWFGSALELYSVVTGLITLVIVPISYLLLGRFILKAGNWFVGPIASLAGGVFAGVNAFAILPYGLPAAVAIGLAASIGMFFVIYPLLYVMGRAILNSIAATRWLKPVLVGTYSFFWQSFAYVWAEFLTLYKRIKETVQPIWADIQKTWSEVWKSIQDTIRSRR